MYWNNNLLNTTSLNAILLNAIPFNILMRNIKQINIKNRTYYLFNDMINIKDFDSSLLKLDKNSCKNIGIRTMDTLQQQKLMIMQISMV